MMEAPAKAGVCSYNIWGLQIGSILSRLKDRVRVSATRNLAGARIEFFCRLEPERQRFFDSLVLSFLREKTSEW
jgi:hypothetical protein